MKVSFSVGGLRSRFAGEFTESSKMEASEMQKIKTVATLRKTVAVLLAALFCLSFTGSFLSAEAADVLKTGECGDALTFTVYRDNSLVISGEGPMWDFSVSNRAGFSGYFHRITKVIIEEGVTSIGDYAFMSATKINDLTLPATLERIGTYAFFSCSALTGLTLPAGVTEIGDRAFMSCSSMDSLEVDENNSTYHSAGDCIIETAANKLILGCNNSVIPADGSVTVIGSEAFYGRAGLTGITIPEGVTSIENQAFYGCTGLTYVALPSTLTSLPADNNQPFINCSGIEEITVADGNPAYYSAGNAVIDKYYKTLVFGCKTTTIAGDGSVITIGRDSFKGHAGLTDLKIPRSVLYINDAFSGCTNLTIYCYEGSAAHTFAVNKGINYELLPDPVDWGTPDLDVESPTPYLPDTGTVHPSYTVTLDGAVLEEGVDYNAEIIIDPGYTTGKVIVTPIADKYYGDTLEKTFEITPAPISSDRITVEVPEIVIAGEEIDPEDITVRIDGDVIPADAYEINSISTDAPTGQVTVTLKAPLSGSVTVAFPVQITDVSGSAQITPIPAQDFTGSEVTPTLTVTVNGSELIPGTDYTVAYVNNIMCGTATVNVTFIGNYTGSASTDFVIKADEYEIRGNVQPTCIEPGYTGEKYLPGTDILIERGTELSALGHLDINDDDKCDRCGVTIGAHFRCSFCDTYEANRYKPIIGWLYIIVHFFIHLFAQLKAWV